MQGIRGAAEEERGWGEEMGQSSRRGMTAGQGGDEEGEMETLMMVVGGPNGKVVWVQISSSGCRVTYIFPGG